MSPALKRSRDAAVVVFLLAVPFFVLKVNMKSPESQNGLDRTVLRMSAPLELLTATVARGVSSFLSDYVYLVDAKADNERLAYDNARLQEQVDSLLLAQVENRQLKRLLQLKESVPSDSVSARVIGQGYTQFFRVTRVVLDKGAREVRPHMPVVSPDGVVGTVLHASGDRVDVELAVDALFAVDVEDERTHAPGFVRGLGTPERYGCKVDMVDSRDDVEIGDVLMTSGKGHSFPRGLRVAKVTRVVKRELGRDQDVDATPTVDFSRLDTVLILVSAPSDDPSPFSAGVPSTGGSRGRP